MYVAAPVEGFDGVVEGYVDLVVDTPDLVVVDYRTDAWHDGDLGAKVPVPAQGAYALALGRRPGDRSRCVFVFLEPDGGGARRQWPGGRSTRYERFSWRRPQPPPP
jgi:hypothetical protein